MTQPELSKSQNSPMGGIEESEPALRRMGFSNPKSAARALNRILDQPLRERLLEVLPHLWTALNEAAGPDRVLSNFERFLSAPLNQPALTQLLVDHPRVIEILVKIFSSSQFLSEILLRNPEYFEDLVDLKRLSTPKSEQQLLIEERQVIASELTPADQLDALRCYQRRELLRIGVCDLLDLFDLPTATRQLSHLANSLLESCLEVVCQPGPPPEGFVVIGMGKLGGQELNYSSDIDILFLTNPPAIMATRTAEKLIDAVARVTTEGFLYRVNMRLRPWGKVGPLVSSPAGYISYLQKNALLWEKQALLKAHVAAGDREAGELFLKQAQSLMFNEPLEAVRADVFAMKQRTEAYVQQKGRIWGDVKLGEGSIRDVEFCVQFLQLAHGKERPEVVCSNTLKSLARLTLAGMIDPEERRVLTDGYIFLRTIEHHLQMMDYRQTHVLPEDPEAIHSLARRLGFKNGEKFLARYRQHSAAIRRVYNRYVGSNEMKKLASQQPTPANSSLPDVNQHRSRMSPSYTETFTEEDIARHASLAARLDRQHLASVDGRALADDTWQISIVAYDFPGELSLICGLMVVFGMDIVKGDAFTYEPPVEITTQSKLPPDKERKIVDVFTVRPVRADGTSSQTWLAYQQDLENLLTMVSSGQAREARGELTKRVGASLYESTHTAPEDDLQDPLSDQPEVDRNGAIEEAAPALTPVEIEFDNHSSERYTLLHINAPDTTGFLYEFTNALALYKIYIARVMVNSTANRVQDTVFVTDENGQKITHPERQRELRAATVLIKHFTHLLPYSPNPESALLHFREFIAQLFRRPNWPDELASLEQPEVLHALARLLGVSDFLWDDFLRMQYTNLYPVVRDVGDLKTVKTREQLEIELKTVLQEGLSDSKQPDSNSAWQEALNNFKDREMFRIDMRHILGQTEEFWDFAFELTDLAEVVITEAYRLCYEDLRGLYGTPSMENGEPANMSVCALGKCGGRELGFASDIELMFIYSSNGQTSGPQVISNAEFYEKLVTAFVRAIRARREGIFEIDLQLRPYGKAGSLSVSLESFRRYFTAEGPAWAYERQALVKLRPVAGDMELGKKVAELRDAFVYSGEPFDVTSMRAMRERQVRHLVTGGTYNLKYGPGGLVDVEYLVQGLQINGGKDQPDLRQTNTREAMAALFRAGILSDEDYTRLRKAHTFLRWLINSLRVVRGNARDVTVPQIGSEEFAFLTRRMPYGREPARLREALNQYTRDVQELNNRLLAR